MLSYKHGFHAGNHADVLKHLVWVALITKLKEKEKPFVLFDTHSGAGLYDLNSSESQKNKEHETGVGKVDFSQLDDPLIQAYNQKIAPFFAEYQYPGSPAIALSSLRDGDKMHLIELHPNEFDVLRSNCRSIGSLGNYKFHKRDGLEALIGMTPPKPNRGAVLIDPPYERFEEYAEVIAAVKATLARWRNGQIAIWYPLLSQRAGKKSGQSEKMVDTLAQLGSTAWKAEFCIDEKASDTGMYGSGMLVINPSWQMDEKVSRSMRLIQNQIGGSTDFELTWLKKEGS